MKHIKVPIIVATLFMLFFNLMPYIGAAYTLIALFFIASPFVTFWMVYKILKDGVPPGKTFEDHWYEDFETQR
jgi:hypothetical protein